MKMRHRPRVLRDEKAARIRRLRKRITNALRDPPDASLKLWSDALYSAADPERHARERAYHRAFMDAIDRSTEVGHEFHTVNIHRFHGKH